MVSRAAIRAQIRNRATQVSLGVISCAVVVALSAVAGSAAKPPPATPPQPSPQPGADPPRHPRPIRGGKVYSGTSKGKDVAYSFVVRRRARVTATFMNTTADVAGVGQTFDADLLNRRGEDVTFPSAESVTPGYTDTLRRRLNRGRHYVLLEGFEKGVPVSFTVRLDPSQAIKAPK